MKGMNTPFKKMLGYRHEGVRNRIFMTSQNLNMAELGIIVYLANCMSKKVRLQVKLNEKLTFRQT